MKKIIIHSLSLLFLLLVSSCILSMEEYIVTEDQRGKDEPYTEKTSYGEFSYQYHDNVIPLNGEPQDYVAMTNDSVIWFMDNLPAKWKPKEGHYIAANCSETFPFGLCSKVLSVTHENGMIRVDHEVVDKSEVYKILEMRLDFDYIMPGQTIFEDDETESRSIGRPGYWKNDSVFVDMSFYEGYSRAADEDYETDVTKFQFNKSIPLKSGRQLYVDLSYQSTEFVKVHQYENLSEEYREEWNDSYTERDVKILIGYGNNQEEASKSLAHFPKDMLDIVGMESVLDNVREDLKKNQHVKTFNPVISIPGCPCGVMFRFDVSVGFTLLGYGVVETKYRSETRRVGLIYNKGDETKIDKVVENSDKEPYNKITNVQFGGSGDVWLRARIGVGIILGDQLGGVGAVFGIEGKVGFRATLETESPTDMLFVDRQNFKAGLYASYSGFGEGVFRVGPFVSSLADFNFNTVEKSWMLNLKAEVNTKKTKSKLVTEEVEYIMEDEKGNPLIDPWTGGLVIGTRNELSINTSLNFSKLENFFVLPQSTPSYQRPSLRIYEGEILNSKGKFKQEIIDEVLTADKTYNFDINLKKAGLDDTRGVYEVVPCIYDKKTGFTTEYRNNSIIVTPGTPTITQPKCYQWYGRELSQEDWEYYLDEYGESYFKGKKREDFTEYAFTTVVELKNATRIKEWGIKYRLNDPNGKVILNKEYSIPFDGICRAGKYTIITTFISEHRPKEANSGIDALDVTALPYCKYDGDKKYFTTSKYINLYYPYDRKGGPYIEGTPQSQNFE